jgi:hypothetical protein
MHALLASTVTWSENIVSFGAGWRFDKTKICKTSLKIVPGKYILVIPAD